MRPVICHYRPASRSNIGRCGRVEHRLLNALHCAIDQVRRRLFIRHEIEDAEDFFRSIQPPLETRLHRSTEKLLHRRRVTGSVGPLEKKINRATIVVAESRSHEISPNCVRGGQPNRCQTYQLLNRSLHVLCTFPAFPCVSLRAFCLA